MKVLIQIKQPSLSWEQIEKVEQDFSTWKDVSIFAYRLALQLGREVRVEYNGNGNYYAYSNSRNYLENSAKEN